MQWERKEVTGKEMKEGVGGSREGKEEVGDGVGSKKRRWAEE